MDAQYEVRLTHQAMMQLQAIRDYISDELCAPDAAINLLRLLKKEMDSLSRMPQRIALTGEEPWRSYGVRRFPVKSYLVYFWIDEENARVQITAVVYSKREQRQALAQMNMN